MEVMGLMLGEFIDDFTVRVVDVFSMPQSGTYTAKTERKLLHSRSSLVFLSFMNLPFPSFWFPVSFSNEGNEATDPMDEASVHESPVRRYLNYLVDKHTK